MAKINRSVNTSVKPVVKSSVQPKRKLSKVYGNRKKENKTFSSSDMFISIIGIIFLLLIGIAFLRTAIGSGSFSEPLTFRALLDILSNSPVIDFASKIQIPTIDITVSWLNWVEFLVNPSIQIINLLVWVVSQLVNFLYFVSYMLYNLFGFNLGF